MKIRALKAHLQERVSEAGAKDAKIRVLIGPEDGAGNFHMRHFELGVGGCTPRHQHAHEHEVLVLKGSGTIHSEVGDRPFNPMDVIYIPPNERHQFCNTGKEPCEFICLIPALCKCGG